ncbi:hypothetical protein D3C76_1083050 [compost metagenome]
MRNVALGTRTMKIATPQSLGAVNCGKLIVDIDGWQITFFIDCGELDYCECCTAPDGRVGTFDGWRRYGTGPVQLLSRWEHEQLDQLLQALWSDTDSEVGSG